MHGDKVINLETTTVPKTAAVKAEAPAKTRKAGPGMMKPVMPSPELAAVVGSDPMPRTAVVAKVWGHIRKHELYLPTGSGETTGAEHGRPRCNEGLRGPLKADSLMA